ncbi:MAG: hypothetical protein JWL62_3272 [Hyphomicrobiales bacterium]|nr:hypothetical protein [Hyphomicrobiales bacterium]
MRKLTTRLAGGALAFGLLLVASGQPATAQVDDSPARYWTLEKQRQDHLREPPRPRLQQRPTHLIRRAAPVRGYVPQEGTLPGVAPDGSVAPKAPDALPEAPIEADARTTSDQPSQAPTGTKTDDKAVIAILGDNLGQSLSLGLAEAFADRPDVTLLRRARENSGLVRDDYYDWLKSARELLEGKEKIAIAVVLLGSNDRQQIRDGAVSADPHTPRWDEIYAARVKALASLFRDKKVPLIWVGLPIMNNERVSTDMLAFNEIYKTAATEAGATYVDVWEAFADDRGQFSAYGPDVSGQMVRLRASDGVQFTRAGARNLAHFVEGDIRRILEKVKPALDPSAVAAARGAASGILEPDLTARPATPQAPLSRPAAGAVTPLTAPPVSPGGRLVTSARQLVRTNDNEAAAIVQQGLVQGRPLEARPGRADDFAWPRR